MELYLPISVNIDNEKFLIRDNCDFRIVLEVIQCLNDENLDDINKIKCSLYNFYKKIYDEINSSDDIIENISDWEISERDISLYIEMIKIINIGEIPDGKPVENKLMDWEHDFNNIIPPINRVLGYSVRDKQNYTHWWDFVGAYMEIGDCYFAQIVSIRNKIKKGKKLDEQDRQFYKEHKNEVDLPIALSRDEQEWLDNDW